MIEQAAAHVQAQPWLWIPLLVLLVVGVSIGLGCMLVVAIEALRHRWHRRQARAWRQADVQQVDLSASFTAPRGERQGETGHVNYNKGL